MKSKNVIAALSIALQLAPIGVYAASAEDAPVTPAVASAPEIPLTRQQLDSSIRSFSIERIEGTQQVKVYGRVFSDCQSKLVIRPEANPRPGVFGIEIVDQGGFLACQQAHGTAACSSTPGDSNVCVSLSQQKSGTITIPDVNVVVKLHSIDPSSDRDSDRHEELGPEFAFVSTATQRSQARERARAAREEQITNARARIRSCRRDADELAIARSSLAWLGRQGVESQANLSKMRKELDRKEIDLLKARIRRASAEELADLEESVVAIADSNCEMADSAATAMHEIAKRYVNGRDAGLDGFERARETLHRTAELSCLSETNQARVESYLRDLEVGRCSKIAESGLSNNFLLQPCVTNVMVNLQNSAVRACSGPSASMENCSQAMTAMRSVQQIPQRAQQVEQQRAQLMQQMQQTFAGLNTPASSGPSSSLGQTQYASPLWAGGSFGL